MFNFKKIQIIFTMENVKNEVITILKKYTLAKDVWDNFTENSSIIKDLKINSARVVDIVIDIEEKYDIEISDKELENLNCFKDIIVLIENKLK